MPEMLQEYVDSASVPLRVDRAVGIIRGVKLLGLRSRNGRRYRPDALRAAASLYEDSKVNINHPKGHPLSPRDYQDRLGVIRDVRFRAGDGLFGDLHFNPKHALSEQLVWDAEHAPQNVGLSHNVLARTARSGDETVVEAITKVQSIDLVADPATTAGLFEQAGRGAVDRETAAEASESLMAWDHMTLEQLENHRPDLVRDLQQAYEAQLENVRQQLDEMATREEASRRRVQILELLQEHNLPLPASGADKDSPLVGRQFIETLIRATDDKALRRLVEQRAELVRSACNWNGPRTRFDLRPRSRDQVALSFDANASHVRNAEEFAAAVRGRITDF
jgi:hypothetical protein